MTTILKDYLLKEDAEELRKTFRVTMDGQFEHGFYNKSFSNQFESDDEFTLQQRIEWWMTIIDRGCPIPHNVYDYTFGELFALYRKAVHTEMQVFVEELKDRQINP